jgi:hypothetical protein
MPAREVPHVWIPPPRRRPVTQQQPICLPQDHGHDAMACHAASVTIHRGRTVLAGVFCLVELKGLEPLTPCLQSTPPSRRGQSFTWGQAS